MASKGIIVKTNKLQFDETLSCIVEPNGDTILQLSTDIPVKHNFIDIDNSSSHMIHLSKEEALDLALYILLSSPGK